MFFFKDSVKRRAVDSSSLREQRIVAAGTHLKAIWRLRANACDNGNPPSVSWMVACRPQLRCLQQMGSWDLSLLSDRVALEESRALVAWLLIDRVSPRALYGLDCLTNDPSPSVRKRVARALRHAEAWAHLRRMASRWPDDEWVQRFAAEPPRDSHSDRLAKFVGQHVERASPSSAPPMALWARDHYWFLSPPKRADYLRRILLRISRWVHGRPLR